VLEREAELALLPVNETQVEVALRMVGLELDGPAKLRFRRVDRAGLDQDDPEVRARIADSGFSATSRRVSFSASSKSPALKQTTDRRLRTSSSSGRIESAVRSSARAVATLPFRSASRPLFRWRRKIPWSKGGASRRECSMAFLPDAANAGAEPPGTRRS
jgi:hypothetical protein